MRTYVANYRHYHVSL